MFSLAAVLSLALGIGANSAVFQLINALRVRSLPVPKAEELVEIRAIGDGRIGRQTGRNGQVSTPLWEQIRDRQQAFSSAAAFADTRFNLAPQGEVRYVEGLFVSGSFFPMLGVQPALGRFLAPHDDTPRCEAPGAVISHSLWQREFAGNPSLTGQLLTVGVRRYPILGVAPQHFFWR